MIKYRLTGAASIVGRPRHLRLLTLMSFAVAIRLFVPAPESRAPAECRCHCL